MFRVMHLVLVVSFVGLALLGYGAREETRALQKELDRLTDRRGSLETEIALLEAEWDHVTSAPYLQDVAARLYGHGVLKDADGAALAPWRPEQTVALRRRDDRPRLASGAFGGAGPTEALETATIDVDETPGGAPAPVRAKGRAESAGSVREPGGETSASSAPIASTPIAAAPIAAAPIAVAPVSAAPRGAAPIAAAPLRPSPTETASPLRRASPPRALSDALISRDQRRWRELFMAQPGAPKPERGARRIRREESRR